jgi:hypothetical protein
MRDNRSKFQAPFDLDIPMPALGIDYQNVSKTDWQYCREATNVWVSPAGNLESRPSVLGYTPEITLDQTSTPSNTRDGSAVTGLYFSPSFKQLFMAKKKSDGNNYLFRFDPDIDGDHVQELGLLTGKNDQVCMLDFIDPPQEKVGRVYIASGGVVQYWDGDVLTVQAIPTVAPEKYAPVPELDYLAAWTDRLWGFKGHTVYGSGYRSPDDWGPKDGAQVGPLGGNIEVRPGDGANITGFCIFQGAVYLTKAASVGHQSSYWTITGSSFLAASTDPYALQLINNGVGCTNPFTMTAVTNSVVFAGADGRIYSQESVDRYAFPEATPLNMKVITGFTGRAKPMCSAFQPMLGYYFLVSKEEDGPFYDIWCLHLGTNGWWKWHLAIDEYPTSICAGPKDILYIGTNKGMIYQLDSLSYGIDGGKGLKEVPYISSIHFGIMDANSTRDKFFEWLFVDYLPLGRAGQMWVDYREGRGYTYVYTASALSESSRNNASVGWDSPASKWDDEEGEIGWDMGGTVEIKNRINRRSSTMQIALSANTPFRLIGLAVTGGMIATRDRYWTKGR